MKEFCDGCGHPATSFHLRGMDFLCRYCYRPSESVGSCRLFEYGVENPLDAKGSTAHVRDIKARRIDPQTKTLFYQQGPKKYFFKT